MLLALVLSSVGGDWCKHLPGDAAASVEPQCNASTRSRQEALKSDFEETISGDGSDAW
jgi:hypothetical protein